MGKLVKASHRQKLLKFQRKCGWKRVIPTRLLAQYALKILQNIKNSKKYLDVHTSFIQHASINGWKNKKSVLYVIRKLSEISFGNTLFSLQIKYKK